MPSDTYGPIAPTVSGDLSTLLSYGLHDATLVLEDSACLQQQKPESGLWSHCPHMCHMCSAWHRAVTLFDKLNRGVIHLSSAIDACQRRYSRS